MLRPAYITDTNNSKFLAVSPCNPNPCQNNAQCMETSDGEFECICSEEFSGPRCEGSTTSAWFIIYRILVLIIWEKTKAITYLSFYFITHVVSCSIYVLFSIYIFEFDDTINDLVLIIPITSASRWFKDVILTCINLFRFGLTTPVSHQKMTHFYDF